MTYTSIEQHTAQSYRDLFPQFIPDEQAPVGISQQKTFYDLMDELYRLVYEQPHLFVATLHEDGVPPALYSAVSEQEQKIRAHMKKFRKAVNDMIYLMYLMGRREETKPNKRQKSVLSRLGINDGATLPPAWVWMAEKENLERFGFPSRFAHCCFRQDYTYTMDIYRKHFGNEAFDKLTTWMDRQGYKPFDIFDTTASDCRFSLTYANPTWSNEAPRGGFEYKIRHTGISIRYEPCCRNPWVIGVCIPNGLKQYLEHFSEMPADVQDFIMPRIKRCDGCRYCVQTDKTGKRPLAKITVRYKDGEQTLCPYYPGYSLWWSNIDDALADNLIALLSFLDSFAPRA